MLYRTNSYTVRYITDVMKILAQNVYILCYYTMNHCWQATEVLPKLNSSGRVWVGFSLNEICYSAGYNIAGKRGNYQTDCPQQKTWRANSGHQQTGGHRLPAKQAVGILLIKESSVNVVSRCLHSDRCDKYNDPTAPTAMMECCNCHSLDFTTTKQLSEVEKEVQCLQVELRLQFSSSGKLGW